MKTFRVFYIDKKKGNRKFYVDLVVNAKNEVFLAAQKALGKTRSWRIVEIVEKQ